MPSAVAGYWSALHLFPRSMPALARTLAAIFIPAAGLLYAFWRAVPTSVYTEPWPQEASLIKYLSDRVGLDVGLPYRGSIGFPSTNSIDIATVSRLWTNAIPTVFQYSQLATPQSVFLQARLFKYEANPNGFVPWVGEGGSRTVLFKTLQAMGVRYFINRDTEVQNLMPRHDTIGQWQVYELPDPNFGDYSPTTLRISSSATEIVDGLGRPEFDFRQQAFVNDGIDGPLVPARDMRLTIKRGGGFHVIGRSDGTSLVLLPQQFSHCLRSSDHNVRLVRTNLMWTGMIFSGAIATDVSFGYGLFSPGCRRDDIADMKWLRVSVPAQ